MVMCCFVASPYAIIFLLFLFSFSMQFGFYDVSPNDDSYWNATAVTSQQISHMCICIWNTEDTKLLRERKEKWKKTKYIEKYQKQHSIDKHKTTRVKTNRDVCIC